jgi:hypothetical protein
MWIHKGKVVESLEDVPNDAIGFVYEIRNKEDNTKYIGKKTLKSKRTLPPLKGTKRKRKVIKESNWKTYYSSNDEIKDLVKQGKSDIFEREILEYAYSNIQLTYLETKYQFIREVLEKDDYLNVNILGKFYKGNL